MNNAQGNSLANAVVAYCANCDQLEALGPTVAKYTVPTCKYIFHISSTRPLKMFLPIS